MIDISVREGDKTADLTLPGGCPLCGGDLALRITEAGARSICRACEWLSTPQLQLQGGAISVLHPPGALA